MHILSVRGILAFILYSLIQAVATLLKSGIPQILSQMPVELNKNISNSPAQSNMKSIHEINSFAVNTKIFDLFMYVAIFMDSKQTDVVNSYWLQGPKLTF